MPVVYTNSSNRLINLTTGQTTYVTGENHTINSDKDGVRLTTTEGHINYTLGGTIFAGGSGVKLREISASDHNEIHILQTGSIESDIVGIEMAGDFNSVFMHGTLNSRYYGLELIGDSLYSSITGTIASSDKFPGQGRGFLGKGDGITVDISSTAHINVNYDGVKLDRGDGHTVTNHGLIQTTRGHGIHSYGSKETEVVNYGTIESYYGMYVGGVSSIAINNGRIEGNQSGMTSGGRFATIINNGYISSNDPEYTFDHNGAKSLLKNTGEIHGGASLASVNGRFVNEGYIGGVVELNRDMSNFDKTSLVAINRGEIVGDVIMRTGEITFVNSGSVLGNIEFYYRDNIYRGGGFVEGVVQIHSGSGRFIGGDHDDHFTIEGAWLREASVFWGNGGDDVLITSQGSDNIRGGKGNDWIHAGNGADTIRGGLGKDEIYAGNGADTINGGMGQDRMAGGLGDDTFVFDRVAGNNVILDFSNGSDKIDLGAFGFSMSDYDTKIAPALSNAGGGATFLDLDALGGSGSVLIQGLAFSDADAADFIL